MSVFLIITSSTCSHCNKMRGETGKVNKFGEGDIIFPRGGRGSGWRWDEEFFRELLLISPNVYNLHLGQNKGNAIYNDAVLMTFKPMGETGVEIEKYDINHPSSRAPPFPPLSYILPYTLYFPIILFVAESVWKEACSPTICTSPIERDPIVSTVSTTPMFAFLPYKGIRTISPSKGRYKVLTSDDSTGGVGYTPDIVATFDIFSDYPLTQPIPMTPKERADQLIELNGKHEIKNKYNNKKERLTFKLKPIPLKRIL